MKFIIIKKSWIVGSALILILLVCGILFFKPSAVPTVGSSESENEVFTFQMVTGEFSSKDDSGKEIESYRWDPGTIVVPKEKEIELRIYGVNGKEHPFFIEGTNVKGVVKKGEETVLTLRFAKEGTYRLICTEHHDIAHNGPMIGYIVVD